MRSRANGNNNYFAHISDLTYPYPSVQTAGEGLNVCLKPNVADEALEFLGARKQELVKHGKNVIAIDITDAVADEKGNLIWGPVIKNRQ